MSSTTRTSRRDGGGVHAWTCWCAPGRPGSSLGRTTPAGRAQLQCVGAPNTQHEQTRGRPPHCPTPVATCTAEAAVPLLQAAGLPLSFAPETLVRTQHPKQGAVTPGHPRALSTIQPAPLSKTNACSSSFCKRVWCLHAIPTLPPVYIKSSPGSLEYLMQCKCLARYCLGDNDKKRQSVHIQLRHNVSFFFQ